MVEGEDSIAVTARQPFAFIRNGDFRRVDCSEVTFLIWRFVNKEGHPRLTLKDALDPAHLTEQTWSHFWILSICSVASRNKILHFHPRIAVDCNGSISLCKILEMGADMLPNLILVHLYFLLFYLHFYYSLLILFMARRDGKMGCLCVIVSGFLFGEVGEGIHFGHQSLFYNTVKINVG